jgi:signal transduction histidine kinase
MDSTKPLEPAPGDPVTNDAAAASSFGVAFRDLKMRLIEQRHPLRFVWSMDADGRFMIEPGDFAALAGAPTAAVQGELWSEAALALGIDPDGAVMHAVATGDTWNGIAVDWPIEATAGSLPIMLSGMPMRGSDRAFEGYRGFGVCRDVDRIAAAIAGRRLALGDQAEGTAEPMPTVADSTTVRTPDEPAEGRPRLTVVPSAANVVPLRAGGTPERRPALSMVERSAFQEIARALGARLEGAEISAPPAPRPEPAPRREASADKSPAIEDATRDLAAALQAQLAADTRAPPGRRAESFGAAFSASAASAPVPLDERVAQLEAALAAAEARARDLEASREEAARASAAKSEFLATLAHEVRTPLTAILGFAEAMIEERFGPLANERYQSYLKDIHVSGAHIISLLNDLLDLAKVEAGMLELALVPLDLNDIVRQCVAIMQAQAGEQRVIMRAALSPGLPRVLGDARSLRQIALNLISNSVKFTAAGGQVIVSTALADAGDVALRVRDTGVGMSAADIATALEPFRQVAAPVRAEANGTGLGLPLTKALVEANGGRFHITSEPHAGTLVEVVFPPSQPV